jgi:hypothetical protein
MSLNRMAWLVALGVMAGWILSEWIDKAISRVLVWSPITWAER